MGKWRNRLIQRLEHGALEVSSKSKKIEGVSLRTAQREISQLENEGLVIRIGKGKYALRGYENGYPSKGQNLITEEKTLSFYFSKGWVFKAITPSNNVVIEFPIEIAQNTRSN